MDIEVSDKIACAKRSRSVIPAKAGNKKKKSFFSSYLDLVVI